MFVHDSRVGGWAAANVFFQKFILPQPVLHTHTRRSYQ